MKTRPPIHGEAGNVTSVSGRKRPTSAPRVKSNPDARPMTAIAVPERPLGQTPYEIAAAKARIARIASRAKTTPPSARKPEPALDIAEADTERWSAQRIDEERELAENSKHEGSLPVPRSSFRVTPPSRFGEGGEIEELDFGGAVE